MSEEKQAVASETVSEQTTQDSDQISSDDKNAAESRKYRKRAQDAEAQLEEMKNKAEKAEEAKLKQIEDYKTLYEQVSSKNESLSSTADKWNKYEETKRASLLEQHPEDEREQLEKLDLETLEFVTSKINNSKPNAPEVIGRSKVALPDKSWGDMTDDEKRMTYIERAKGN